MAVAKCSVCWGKGSLDGRPCPACRATRTFDTLEGSLTGVVLIGLIGLAAAGLYFLWKHPVNVAQLARIDARAALAPTALGTPKTTDFSWVTKAMEACDKAAADDREGLHFLIIPLALAEKTDDKQQLPQSLGTAGNANLVPTNDAVEALKNGTLKVYPGEYVFRVSAGNTVFRWNRTSGVATFSRPDVKSLETFRLGFQTLKDRSAAGEASEFTRSEGNCHWVSAVITQ